MKKSRVSIPAASVVGFCMMGGSLAGFAPTDAVTSAEKAVAAVQHVAPAAVSDIAALMRTDADIAVQVAAPGGGSVQLPKRPSDGVQIVTPGDAPNVTIGLPFAERASEATPSPADGVVVYDNNNGSSTVPVVHADGTVQISTVIENSSAPKRYDYDISVPAGQKLQLAPDGGAYVSDDEGIATGHFAAPWAKDANGNVVDTHYEVNGDVLTQVVDFSAGAAFPVVADPSYYAPVTWIYSRAAVEDMWRVMNQLGNICSIPGMPWPASAACLSGAGLKNAITQAHYQKKRIKGYYYQCKSGGYCSYSTYAVVN